MREGEEGVDVPTVSKRGGGLNSVRREEMIQCCNRG